MSHPCRSTRLPRRLLLPGACVVLAAVAGPLHAQAAPAAGTPDQVELPSPAAAPFATAIPTRRTAPFATLSASATDMRDSIVALARAQLGRRYVFGGTTPEKGFDCSGLIRYITAALKLDVPRTAAQQSRVGLAVAKDPTRLRPGDLLTFGNGKKVEHIGIYVGDGKFIHASTKAGRVVESRLDRPRYKGVKPWQGVRRLFADADTGRGPGG